MEKQALETQQGQFERMLEMYTETRETARALKSKSGAVDLHWDLLQVQYNTSINNRSDAIKNRNLINISTEPWTPGPGNHSSEERTHREVPDGQDEEPPQGQSIQHRQEVNKIIIGFWIC